MTVPAVGSFAQELYTDLEPLAYDDADQDYALLAFSGALGAMFQQVRDLARQDSAGNPGWSLLLDVDRCPTAYLPYLGQFVGVTVDTSLTDAQQRDQIRGEQGMGRGTVAAIVAAASKFLTGSKTVILLERTPDNYSYTVITYASESPGLDIPTTNLIINGGFESSAAGWGGSGFSQSTDQAKFGSHSAKWVTATSVGIEVGSSSAITGISPGDTFTFSIWLYSPTAGDTISYGINYLDSANHITSPHSDPVLTTVIGWQRVEVTAVAGASTTKARPYMTYLAGATPTFYVDGAQLEKLPFSTPYVDTNGAAASRAAGSGPIGAALRAGKPAGLILDYLVVSGETWAQLIASYATWADVIAAFPTWQDVINNTP